MKTTLLLLSLILLLNCASKDGNDTSNNLIIGSWKLDSHYYDFDNQPSEKKDIVPCSEYVKHTYSKDGTLYFTIPKWGDPNCELRDKSFWTGTWGIINDTTLVTRNKHSYKNGQTNSYCSETTFKITNSNSLKIISNYNDAGISSLLNNEHIIGETVIYKRIE